MTLLDAAIEPFHHGFMLQALAVGTFVCVVCAVMSCFIVLKGWSLVGDALAHAVLPGVVGAYILGVPMALGAVASGVACVALAGAARATSRVKPDALLGIAFTGFMAVGLILMVATPSDIHFTHVLFGNLLGLQPSEVAQVVAIGAVALIGVGILAKDLILFCFDPGHARVVGLAPGRLEMILLVLVAMTTVAALQAVGTALVMAMLITPGAVGFLMADRFGRMMAWSTGSAATAAVTGTLASFWLDGATGPSIALVQSGLFVIAFALSPKRRLARARPA